MMFSANSFPIVASHRLAGSKSARHRGLSPLMYKAKAHSRMAETSLVVREGNRNSSPTFLFSVWAHPRIPCVSKNMDASCRRKSNNGKRTMKQTRPICSSGAQGRNVVHSWTPAVENIRDSFYRHFLIMRYISNVLS